MKLSIIVPIYNVEKYVAQCLDSVLDQDLDRKEYEIIIVNDGSTDSSLEIAQTYAIINDNIIIINKANGGVGSARNSGMDAANGKYIYFLDSDDYLVSNSLKELVDMCELHNLDILTFMSAPFSSLQYKAKSISKKDDFRFSFGDKDFSPIVTGEEYVANVNYRGEIWWFLSNREFLKNSGIRFIEGRWMEDIIFSIELFLQAKRMAHLKLDVHRHRVTSGTAMTSKEPSHYLKIIRDLQNAAVAFGPIINSLENKAANPQCVARIKARQQSLVFFSMVRMLKSTISLKEVKVRMNEMSNINAFPLNSFLGKDYNCMAYQMLTRIFSTKRRFYLIFQLFNPILKLR